jgi:hemerythrin-like domain-containing protein
MTDNQAATGGARPDRRMFGAAVGGLAIGFAGTFGLDHALRRSPGSPARPPSPAEELMTEHGVLVRVLLAYRASSALLAGPRPAPTHAILAAAQIISGYIEDFHEGLEEAYVFPYVAAQPRYAPLIRTLLTQHDRGRHLTAAIKDVAAQSLDASSRAQLKGYLDGFVAMYEPHEAWEDTVVYPAFRAATSQSHRDELADRIASYQAGSYSSDGLGPVLEQLTAVETELGIEDLNTFTPAEPTQAPTP